MIRGRIGHWKLTALMGLMIATTGCAAGDGGIQSPAGSPTTSQLGPAATGSATPRASVPPPPTASGGAPGATVTGRYLERTEPAAAPRGISHVTIGLYEDEFQPGSNAFAGSPAAGGKQIAATVTGENGTFRLTGIPAGTWFLVRPDGVVPTPGTWVRVTAATGADVDLMGCPYCPPAA